MNEKKYDIKTLLEYINGPYKPEIVEAIDLVIKGNLNLFCGNCYNNLSKINLNETKVICHYCNCINNIKTSRLKRIYDLVIYTEKTYQQEKSINSSSKSKNVNISSIKNDETLQLRDKEDKEQNKTISNAEITADSLINSEKPTIGLKLDENTIKILEQQGLYFTNSESKC
jgi:hypothetical protein